ncbi:reverse transcriptase domain-containing protein [Citrus sinensis]|uniref:Reverse transcriptase domain-containing protein n=1 Tax=Citrus sinensis TaxID=2711 RepID=A0ACB8KT32_CITSI|nr:reverse transcriptase domain-containing protein [Citrus sinensis]
MHSRPFRFQAAWLTNESFQDFVAESWDQTLHHLDAADQFRLKRALESYSSKGLSRLEEKLKVDLEEVLTQEEIIWHQKSRKDWLLLGDRNTSYYHHKTLTRRRQNNIAAVQNNEGVWLYDQNEIKAHAIQFYSSLYSCDSLNFRHYPHPNCFPIIEEDLLQLLNNGVEDAEVQKTIFGMHPLKALGLDGFHVIFYQSQWNTVGSSLCRLVKEVFQNKYLPGGLNSTLLALIPKSESSSSFKMYRPISLCNVAYKTITKVIANRLQFILPHLVGPHQISFVPGRHITENIVIAQEVVHSMRRKTGSTGFLAIKVDLENAYDRLSWEFISDILREARIPSDLIQVIMACITSATMRVFWNGEATEEFSPSRGIRQGCPLSPYLFILCIERLSHGIHNVITARKWHPIMLSRNGIPLSHLFFTDDLLLFTEANVEQAKVISAVILGFLGFSVASDLGKYLGVPLHHSRVSSSMFQNIVDKVEKRLSGWNASHLSLAGRITLAQSVLQAIPIYVMQTVSLPNGVRERIDRACMRFIWSGSSPQQKLSMVSWRHVCKPKAFGGLGFKSLAMMNRALHMKLAWGIISSPSSLWVQVLLTKYRVDRHNPPQVLLTRYGSHLWKSLGHVWSEVADFVNVNGSWCWSRFEHYLPSNIILKIAAFHPPSYAKGMDAIFWAHSKHGQFTTSSAYLALSDQIPAAVDRDWRMIWSWQGPQSVRIFLWQTFHASLKTKAELVRRHLPISSRCDRCGAVCEDVIHALRDCPLPWCTLNTDGAHRVHGTSTAGGLIRDHLGRWLTRFGMMIGSCSVTVAELWGLYQGLQLAWNFGIRNLRVETDSLCVTQLAARPSVTPNEYAPLIQAIKDYLNLDWQVSLSHIYREANFAADYMANLAFSIPLGFMVYPTPPLGVRPFLLHDSYGVSYPRSVVL